MNDTNYYVYELIDPRNKTVFYVGKGKTRDKLNRVYRRISDHLNLHDKSNKLKTNIIKKVRKLGLEIITNIIKEQITELEAFQLEIELIKRYGKRIDGNGTLANLTDGGEGLSGHKMTEKTKKILSRKHKARIKRTGIVNFKGEKHTLETRQRMSLIQKAIFKTKSGTMKGKHHTEATKQKLSQKMKGRQHPLPQQEWYRFGSAREKNHFAKKYLFINPNGEQFEICGYFKQFIKDNGLSIDTCKKYINKGKIPLPINLNHNRMSENRIKTTGWEIRYL